MKALEFLEFCRTINCLSYSDFQKMYHSPLLEHIWGKFLNMRVRIIFELDEENMEILYNYTHTKIKNREKKT